MSGKHPRREDALEALRRHKEEFERRYGATQLGVFGSVARDEATEESDVDVVVRLREPKLFNIVNIKEDLESELGRHDEFFP